MGGEPQPPEHVSASLRCQEGSDLTETLTVTSYLTLLPTSRSDRIALSPRTTPEKKSCWGTATLARRGQNRGCRALWLDGGSGKSGQRGRAQARVWEWQCPPLQRRCPPLPRRCPPRRGLPRDGQRQLDEDTGTGQDWMQLLLADAGEWRGQVWAASPGTTPRDHEQKAQPLQGELLANAPHCHPPWAPSLTWPTAAPPPALWFQW